METVGLVGLGHMGAGIGRALRTGGTPVLAARSGRSPRSVNFAEQADIRLVSDLEDVLELAEIVVVVAPPGAALTIAEDLVGAALRTGARPLVADLNAIAPATVLQIQRRLRRAGLDCVDGSISGPPPWTAPGARLYLSGPQAGRVAGLGWHDIEVTTLGPELGSASALKMCLSGMQKGLLALATQALMTAEQHDVLHSLVDEADRCGLGPALRDVPLAARKAPRYVDEMREISTCFEQVPAASQVFNGLEQLWRAVAASHLARGHPEATPLPFDPVRTAAGLRRAQQREP